MYKRQGWRKEQTGTKTYTVNHPEQGHYESIGTGYNVAVEQFNEMEVYNHITCLLYTSGTGIAMGNAKDEVKAKADFACQSVENDGIYHYCLDNNLINNNDD